MKFLLLLSAFITIVQSAKDHGHEWNYENKGPDFWREEFKNCKGLKQSPINIKTDTLEYDPNLQPFKFSNYDKTSHWNVSHNGHTVIVTNILDKESEDFSVEGSDFDEKFHLLQFHFHWGYNDYQGSEHLIDEEKFPLEMHLVHRSNNGSFTVLGFLFQLSKENNPNLDSLLNGVKVARGKGQWQNVTFSLESLLPDLSSLNYYRYSGSLTTPPCSEGVIWNVITSYINISSTQLSSFRLNMLKINYRDPQKMYDRQVYSSFEVPNSVSRQRSQSDQQCSFTNNSNESIRIFILNGFLSILASILFFIKF